MSAFLLDTPWSRGLDPFPVFRGFGSGKPNGRIGPLKGILPFHAWRNRLAAARLELII
jgi:hypothetical protein